MKLVAQIFAGVFLAFLVRDALVVVGIPMWVMIMPVIVAGVIWLMYAASEWEKKSAYSKPTPSSSDPPHSAKPSARRTDSTSKP